MSRFGDRTKSSQFAFVALGIVTKLGAALVLLVILQNYFALDIHISRVRPLVAVQLIVLDNLPHISLSGLLKYAGDLLRPHS